MSGGHFDYAQYRIDDIIDSIEQTIGDATKERPPLVTKVGVSVKEIVEKGHYRYVNKHFDSFGEAIRYYSNNRNYKVLEQNKEKLLVEDVFSGEMYEVINPTKLCKREWGWWRCMVVCLWNLTKCKYTYFMPNYVYSKGARIELFFAKLLRKTIYFKC